MDFHLTKEQEEQYLKWRQQFMTGGRNYGAIGGHFSFVFIPTTIGMVVKVRFSCGSEQAELDLTDYSGW
jgi:hypothetical protein